MKPGSKAPDRFADGAARPPVFLLIVSILVSAAAPTIPGFLPVLSAEPPPDRGVFYVAHPGTSYEFRLYQPGAGSVLIGETGIKPDNIFWRDDFSELYYRSGNRMMKRDWRAGATETEALVLPDGTDPSGKLWIDDDTGLWRYFRIAGPGETAEVYEYSDRKKMWKPLAAEPTHGCRSGDESACGLEVRSYTKGRKRTVSLEDLLHEMGVWSHLGKLNVMIRNEPGMLPFFLPTENEPDATLQVTVGIGETLDGLAPLNRISKSDGSKIEIYGAEEPGCPKEVAFMEFQRWLLAAAENSGRCGRVADLRDGTILFRLPADSEGAVWIPSPKAAGVEP